MTISTTLLIVLINVTIFLLLGFVYVIVNLLKKNEKLEDMNVAQDTYIQQISTIMTESNRKIKEIQEYINEYNINK